MEKTKKTELRSFLKVKKDRKMEKTKEDRIEVI